MLSRTLINRPTVERLVREVDLDLGVQTKAEKDALVDSVTRSISIGSTGRDNLYTLSYQDQKPEVAQRVVQALLTIFVESSMGVSRQDSDSARRFLDDQAWLETRRIMELLRGIEARALALRETPPPGPVHSIDALHPDVDLPMERPLYRAPTKTVLTATALQAGYAEGDAQALFDQVRIDEVALARHIRQSLQMRTQISLGELLQTRPLQQGLGELVAYLQLASGAAPSVVDEAVQETVHWASAEGRPRSATLPRILFVRP